MFSIATAIAMANISDLLSKWVFEELISVFKGALSNTWLVHIIKTSLFRK